MAERERWEAYTVYVQSVQQINPVGVKTKMPSPQCHVPERNVPKTRIADPDTDLNSVGSVDPDSELDPDPGGQK